MISKYQVLLDLHSANDIVLRFEEVEERSTFCHVLLAQHRAAAGFKLIPVVEVLFATYSQTWFIHN
jgi:hypothetical protein